MEHGQAATQRYIANPPLARAMRSPAAPAAAFLAFLALLAILLAPAAAAQSVGPTASLALSLPAGPTTIPLGGTHQLPFDVKLTLNNIVCAQDGNATVTFAVKDVPSPLTGVKGMVMAPASFKVPAGAYAAGTAFTGTASSMLHIQVGTDAPPDHTHVFQVTGAFDGNVAGCTPVGGSMPAAQAAGNHTIVTGPAGAAAPGSATGPGAGPGGAGAPPAASNGTALAGTNAGSTPPPAKATPVGWAPLLGGVAVALAVLRRSRRGAWPTRRAGRTARSTAGRRPR